MPLPTDTQKTKLLISIVSYNSLAYLIDCLNSIRKYPPSCSYRVVVVDNASLDGTAETVRDGFGWVKLIVNKENKGFAAANNIAVSCCRSRYVLLMNSDCRVYENSLDGIVDFMDKNKDAAVVGPMIVNSDGTIQHSCRRFPSMFAAAVHTLLAAVYPANPFSLRYKMADVDRSRPFEVDWVSGSAMGIRRKALDEVGPLDERFFMYVEDLDFCYRAWKKGWKVYYYPHAMVMHHIGGSSGGESLSSTLRMQKSVLLFYLKNYKRNWRIIFIPALAAVLASRIFFTMIRLRLGRSRILILLVCFLY
ncbi:MAG: glycosyltransferase family 2 protein [Actinomycetota bacterium]